jgi:hypothetical protein
MNNTITFPAAEAELKLSRPGEKWAATLAEERLRLQEDQEILRAREHNLREYEHRLRLLQAEIEAGRAAANYYPSPTSRSMPPIASRPSNGSSFLEDPALNAAWEKLHRARELMDSELKNLREEQIALREMESHVRAREESVATREAQLSAGDVVVPVAASPDVPVDTPAAQSRSAVTRFTRVPFNMAMSVIRGKK